MTKEYVEGLSELIKCTTKKRFKKVKLEVKHFFSGAAIYANKKICITLTPVGLAIKLPEEVRNTLIKQKGAKRLRYFSKGHIKKEYIVLPKVMLNEVTFLRLLVKTSIEYMLNLSKDK